MRGPCEPTPSLPSLGSQRLEKSFPEEYAARRAEEQEAAAAAAPADGAADAPLPLFIMSLLLPGAFLLSSAWARVLCRAGARVCG